MDEHMELLVELMRKTIEQKDEQIQKLNETIEELRVIPRPASKKPLKSSAGNFLVLPVNGTVAKIHRHRKKSVRKR